MRRLGRPEPQKCSALLSNSQLNCGHKLDVHEGRISVALMLD